MGESYMEWDKNNIGDIVGFINRELGTGRPMNNIELEEFGVNERVIHKRLLRIGYKKIDNQYCLEDSIISNITNNTKKINKVNKQSNITYNRDLDMDKLNLLLDSDRDAIKAHIVEKHHYFCYTKKYIDDYSLDCLEKRYEHYVAENGNSYVEDLMEELRALPKRPKQ